MKKVIICFALFGFICQNVLALDTVFDSMDNATEVKLAPSINSTKNTKSVANTTKKTATTVSIQQQKYNDALVSLDDAQVELREQLQETNARYTSALSEKEKAISNCKTIKKEISAINKKMKNIDKSKKIINKNISVDQ